LLRAAGKVRRSIGSGSGSGPAGSLTGSKTAKSRKKNRYVFFISKNLSTFVAIKLSNIEQMDNEQHTTGSCIEERPQDAPRFMSGETERSKKIYLQKKLTDFVSFANIEA
jgi:hypothetical protein